MKSRFGMDLQIAGEADALGFVKTVQVNDGTLGEYHVSELREASVEDARWLDRACVRAVKNRAPRRS